MALATSSFIALSSCPASLRLSGSRAARPFIKPVIVPFFPRAVIRISSNSLSVEAE